VLDKQEDEALENTNGKRPLLRFFALVDKVQLLLLYRKETFHPLDHRGSMEESANWVLSILETPEFKENDSFGPVLKKLFNHFLNNGILLARLYGDSSFHPQPSDLLSAPLFLG
jgi:hypothetical protein